jgi:hypothetical protein
MRRLAPLILGAVLAAGCTSTVEIEKTLSFTDVHTGWYDAGLVNGQNKLVPSISLRLKNNSPDPVAGVQLNAIFHRVGESDAWGEHYVSAVGRDGLPGGATTGSIVLRSTLGYTGTQSRLEIMQNRAFVDARVEIFGKQGRRNWVKLKEFTIDRQLLTR